MSTDYFPDVLAQADLILDELRDSMPCASCGSLTPARLGSDLHGNLRCSDCYDGWPRCGICTGWILEHQRAVTVDIDGPAVVHEECV